MDLGVFLAVLAAALCHASWNAGLKLKIDPAVAITLTAVAAGAVALPLLPFTGLPAGVSWPWLATSLALHLVYWVVLGQAYRFGDLGHVYPIARGAAPLITITGGALAYGETPGALGSAGVVLLAAGILLLSLRTSSALARLDARATAFALATAATIAAYTLVDGRGARASGNPHGYAVLFFVLDGVMMAIYGAMLQAKEMRRLAPWQLPVVLGGGALSLVAYWIALWAMTVAPIALVAAVRESSVLFAAAIGVLLLGEPVIGARLVAALLVVMGLVLIRLG